MYELIVLASGRGSTFANLVEHTLDEFSGMLFEQAKISLLITDRYCRALDVANQYEIPCKVVAPRDFPDKNAWCRAMFSHRADLYLMAGFLRHVVVPDDLEGRILNIHPSLLPAYGGKGMYGHKVHQAVIDNKERETGCSVHVVDNEYDHGPVIAQSKMKIMPWDDASSVEKAVKDLESRLYPRAVLNYLQVLNK